MPFERSLEIERRLTHVLRLIRTGRFSTPMLAEEVGVSIPTISRCITALRDRGHEIQAEMRGGSWRYMLPRKPSKDQASSAETTGPLAATRLSSQQ